MAKAPLHKLCGTSHWSTQPCPAVKKARTVGLSKALRQNKLVSDATVFEASMSVEDWKARALKAEAELEKRKAADRARVAKHRERTAVR